MRHCLLFIIALLAFISPYAGAQDAKPTSTPATPAPAQTPANEEAQVWVNTKTHIYHKKGSRWYGKTKEGRYMSEADAIKEGDKAAKK